MEKFKTNVFIIAYLKAPAQSKLNENFFDLHIGLCYTLSQIILSVLLKWVI